MKTFDDAVRTIHTATDPVALFGPRNSDGGGEATGRGSARVYRQFALLVHPDRVPAQRSVEAQAAFTRLSQLWQNYQREPEPSKPVLTTISTDRRVYTVGTELAHGDLANLRRASYTDRDGRSVNVLLKVPRSAESNDLMCRESLALRRLADKRKAATPTFAPRLFDTFQHHTPGTLRERTANVLETIPGFHTLTEVKTLCPDGLEGLDLAWVWSQLLVALGHAHRAGVVHGAVVPDHVLVRPENKELRLVDWCYSVVGRGRSLAGEPAPVIEKFADFYPPGTSAEQVPSEAADLHMATRCLTTLFREDTPVALLRFAQRCLMPTSTRRPSILQLIEDFDKIITQLYGSRLERRYHRSGIRFARPPAC